MMMDREMKKLAEMEKGRAEVVSIGRNFGPPTAKEREEYSFKMVQVESRSTARYSGWCRPLRRA